MKTNETAARQGDAESLRQQITQLIQGFEDELRYGDLRSRVKALIPIVHGLRDLGKALIPAEYASAARDRILHYFRKYPLTVIDGDELLVISGIQEYARRVRELRVEFGWPIVTGVTINEMGEEEGVPDQLKGMKPSQYALLRDEEDREAAHRWNIANTIRKGRDSVRDRILDFLRTNVGRGVTNEELRYVAGNKTEWARRVRELRTEFGWPIVTRTTGDPDLPIGVYVLQADRQSPEHDRDIADDVRRGVLRRDSYKCQDCGWSHEEWNPSDPRHLELHHIRHHADGGENLEANLRTLCTVCHDSLHCRERET